MTKKAAVYVLACTAGRLHNMHAPLHVQLADFTIVQREQKVKHFAMSTDVWGDALGRGYEYLPHTKAKICTTVHLEQIINSLWQQAS